MDLAYFVVLIGSLIFVHELGHFLVAKAFGVKVITFSLGFGPKVLRFNGRETEYCLSLLPLGGYVKMLEESRSAFVLPEDRKRTLESLALYKRVLIVLAGPTMNLVFPILLYFSVFVTDGPFAPPTVGMVLPGRPADGVLSPGDRIMSINGEEVGTFDEVRRIVEKSPRKSLKIQVFRDNHHEQVEVIVQEQRRALELDLTERFGSIGIQPNMPAPVIGITGPDTAAFRAGLRSFDRITFVAGRPIHRFRDIELELEQNRGETVPVTYLRPTRVPGTLGGLLDMAVFEAGVVAFTPGPNDLPFLARTGIESVDLYAAVVPPGSYLYQAGLREGDRLKLLDDEPLAAWSSFVDTLADSPDVEHKLTFVSARDGLERSGLFEVRREDFVAPNGERFHKHLLPCGSWANRMETGTPGCAPGSVQQWLPLALEDRVLHPAPIRYALGKAVQETWSVTRLVSLAFVRLFQGKASLEELTGPIGIYEIAGRERRKGAEYFIWVMALLSINLGLLNLMPIPVLDGGHLFLFGVEAILRRTLPMRVRELAHILGMAMLVFLMGVAFKNDVDRRSQDPTSGNPRSQER